MVSYMRDWEQNKRKEDWLKLKKKIQVLLKFWCFKNDNKK